MAKSKHGPFSTAHHPVGRASGGKVADQVAEQLIKSGEAKGESDAYSLASGSPPAQPESTGGRLTKRRAR